ncbi:MAG: protoporphyrinogen oxidase, partial [Dissulfurimicrobium sp.]
PGGVLMSFAAGMNELVEALYRDLSDIVRLDTQVISIRRMGRDGFSCLTADGEEIEATHVVVACPAREASRIMSRSFPAAADAAFSIYYPPISIVAIGVHERHLPGPLDGFGFLCPSREKRDILGVLWDSSIFSGRAPSGYCLIRVLIGGARAPELARMPQENIVQTALKELKDLLGLKAGPEFVRVFKWDEAIPQYNVGHADVVRRVVEGFDSDRIKIRCNWVGGVSLNDCVANSETLAREMAQDGNS